jgi:ADP-ribosyl-[dinitrogen reductase] hydrolase
MSDTGALFDRALGAYLGLAIGDALGATVEFMRPREIQAQYGVHREIIGGGWLKLARGQVTDDTTMSLALGEAMLSAGAPLLAAGDPVATQQIAEAFVRWLRSKPVDCGNTCRRGIQRYLSDGSLVGPANEGDAGNGALMRNLPVVLATLHDDALLTHWSLAQARITHHHALSDAATLGLSRLLRSALLGAGREALAEQALGWVAAWPVFRFQPYPGRATAHVVYAVHTVLHHFLAHPDPEMALVATVNQGDDADTTGALVGMLAGACCGASQLPCAWLQRLQPATVRAITDQVGHLLALADALRAAPPHAGALL